VTTSEPPFDETVIRAMAKWPDVPDVYGWLSLDQRGRWRLRGDVVNHPGAIAFINRNYSCDDRGCWFFQNGPQRVFVTLGYTPWVYKIVQADMLRTHTEQDVPELEAIYVDDQGRLLLLGARGIGVLLDTDIHRVLDRFRDERGERPSDPDLEALLETVQGGESAALDFFWAGATLPVAPIRSARVALEFGFIAAPQPP